MTVGGDVVGSIRKGLVCLIGIGREDDVKPDVYYIVRKHLQTKLWPDPETGAPWRSSILSNEYEVLVISQFTLHGVIKGNRTDFHRASMLLMPTLWLSCSFV